MYPSISGKGNSRMTAVRWKPNFSPLTLCLSLISREFESVGSNGKADPTPVAVLVDRVPGHPGEVWSLILRDGVPVGLEALEGGWRTTIVGIEDQEQLTPSLRDGPVARTLLAPVGLVDVAHRKRRFVLPSSDEIRRSVGRLVVDNQPLEVAKCLGLEAFVHARKRVGSIARRREHGEGERR